MQHSVGLLVGYAYYVEVKCACLIANPDQRFVEILEMITHFTSSESKSKKEKMSCFSFKFSSLERSLCAHDKFEVHHFCPLEIFSEKFKRQMSHLSGKKETNTYVYVFFSKK